jgi:hypothetical protein
MDGVGDHDKRWYCRLLAISTPSMNEPPRVKPGAWSVTAISARVEKRTWRDMSLRTLRQRLVGPDPLVYGERRTFTQNEIKRDKNEVVWHRVVL